MRFSLLPLALLLALGCGDDDGAADSGMADTSTVDSGGADTGADAAGDDAGDDAGGDDAGDDAAADDATVDDAAAPSRECETDDDCRLLNDCCSCAAVSADAVIAECPEDCLQPSCDAAGIAPVVGCLAGTCTMLGLNCDEDQVLCDGPTPACEAGTVPHVQDGCWSSLCIPVESCESVPSCDTCPENRACVLSQGFVERITCFPIDPTCGGTPTCECMGDEACGGSPFMCVPTTTGEQDLTCVCPAC